MISCVTKSNSYEINCRTPDVRVLAVSNVERLQLVRQERFRADPHYRLNVMELRVPPLRTRRENIVLLARHFVAAAARRYNMTRLEPHPNSVHWLLK